jgi:hypothetical protein
MRAQDLAEPYPFVTTADDAIDAARMPAEQSLPALLVLDADGQPYSIVPGSQLIRQLLPSCIIEDPLLAGVVDERPRRGCRGGDGRGHRRDGLARGRTGGIGVGGADRCARCLAHGPAAEQALTRLSLRCDRHRGGIREELGVPVQE